MENIELNIKEICKNIGISQKDLAETIGMTPEAFNTAVSANKLSKQAKSAIKLFIENQELKKENIKFKEDLELIKKAFRIIGS